MIHDESLILLSSLDNQCWDVDHCLSVRRSQTENLLFHWSPGSYPMLSTGQILYLMFGFIISTIQNLDIGHGSR